MSLGASLLIAPLLVVSSGSTTGAAPSARSADDHIKAAEAAVARQRIAMRTAYTEAGPAPPVGALYTSFASLAVYDAALEGHQHGRVAATVAVATAAHDVLHEYFPASRPALNADPAAMLATLPNGAKAETGAAIGAAAADAMIASRVGDGRNNAAIAYSKAPAAGIWQPPASGMALARLGFVKPVVDVPPVALDGPDALTSAAYAADYNEVRLLGSTTSTTRTDEQTAIARFMAPNVNPVYRDALCRYLESEPVGLIPVTRMFARIDGAIANAFIQSWRLKYDLGYWRPFRAIAGAETDGNPATGLHPTPWLPLVPNPAYSDYTSGHAAGTSPFAEVVRQTLGDDITPVLRSGGLERTYTSLSALEHDAFHARIWGGLHFRDAMEDGYLLGHTMADQVMRAIR
ncbi:vanadium-dependent haloperoxidase [Nocardioides sp. B-3]|uniref:vanadium-dependent haloperoxidase n=1 Tax=Nocardioides sp. B-3 TaxID=2895565 RepID=UPI002153266C|nr:vanadium-dependent haloperoxidase [Nocardioides sp. B-3]UUZ61366.1 vanadium-dependent haloperoxidase [Nocardioides sp. B-3]